MRAAGAAATAAIPPFERIVADYGPLISRIAMSYEADPALREDLTQQIFLAVWQALPAFRADSLAEDLHRPGRAEPLDLLRHQAGPPAAARRAAGEARSRRRPIRKKARSRSTSARCCSKRPAACRCRSAKSSSSCSKVSAIPRSPKCSNIAPNALALRLSRAKTALKIDVGAQAMNDFDLDRLGDVWRQQPDPEEMAAPAAHRRRGAPARALGPVGRYRGRAGGRGVVISPRPAPIPERDTLLMGGARNPGPAGQQLSASASCARSS